jgi:DNA polymerase III epsilon subunit-like protein
MIGLVLDTETTGLIENHVVKLDRQPEIIEFAAITFDWDELPFPVNHTEAPKSLREYDELIKPRLIVGDLPEETKKRTGISWDDVKDKPHFKAYADDIAELINTSELVVGHNLSFDMEMVDLEFERLGRRIAWPQLKICTVEQSNFYLGRRAALGELYRSLTGEEHKKAHRALGDVEATLRCLRVMRELEWI